MPTIPNRLANCNKDPNCSAPNERLTELRISPFPANREVTHSGAKNAPPLFSIEIATPK